ncbi:hypothetical protein L2E82_01539 [Cichorium intybus]|uniref:Uncharacterized protein n=1 Tax=Cichorium intybus TaxID=13427 RepID=A0ACB9GZ98_CICIN|nr:hypothetical protein L2E82_01539 [Cichorium intybus]
MTWFFWLLYKNPVIESGVVKEIEEKSYSPIYDEVKDMGLSLVVPVEVRDKLQNLAGQHSDVLESLSPIVKKRIWLGFGIFHTDIEVYGMEYGFRAQDYSIIGVFEVELKRCPGFSYRCHSIDATHHWTSFVSSTIAKNTCECDTKSRLKILGESDNSSDVHYQRGSCWLLRVKQDVLTVNTYHQVKGLIMTAQEEKRRQPKHSKDEMPPRASLQGGGKRGHHMGDYIPQEELDKFMAICNDVTAQKVAKEAVDKARIQADNLGHRLLSKMGRKEGEELGCSRSDIPDPIMGGNVEKDNLGVGASQPGELTPDDDIYEQYKKRIMVGYPT